MADLKISQLTGASTPLAGTEVLPIVQSGSTKKVSVADLTLGRAVASAGGTFSDNFVQGTAAKGVNFTANTPAAGMTSQLLNWYEEGTWTPTIIGSSTAGTGTYSLQEGTYTRIGRQVTVTAAITWSAHTGSGVLRVSGLPFTIKNDNVYAAFALEYADLTVSANAIACIVTRPGQTYLQVDETVAGGTGQSGVTLDTAASLYFSVTYFV